MGGEVMPRCTRSSTLLLCLLFGITPALGQTLSSVLEEACSSALANQIADSRVEQAKDDLAAATANSGWRLFAHAGWAVRQDVISSQQVVRYSTGTSTIGLSLPLLGSAQSQQRAVLKSKLGVEEARVQGEKTRHTVERLVLEANSTLYFAKLEERLAETFLRNDSTDSLWLQRREQAHLLLLSDQEDFLSMFDLARRDLAKAQAGQSLALSALRRLSSSKLGDYIPVEPPVSAPYVPVTDTMIDSVPAVRAAAVAMQARQKESQMTNFTGISASLDFSTGYDPGFGVPNGWTAGVGVQASIPLQITKLRRAERQRLQEAALQSRLDWENQRQETGSQLRDLQSQLQISRQDLVASWRQLGGAYAAWVIAKRRAASLGGDVLEKELQARYALYQAAIAYTRAQQRAAQSVIAWAVVSGQLDAAIPRTMRSPSEPEYRRPVDDSFPIGEPNSAADSSGRATLAKPLPSHASASRISSASHVLSRNAGLRSPALALLPPPALPRVSTQLAQFRQNWFGFTLAALGPSAKGRRLQTSLGWYVWNGEAWLADPAQANALPDSSRVVLLSFKAPTLDSFLDSPEAADRLRRLVSHLHASGLQVYALFGYPQLVFPQGRRAVLRWLPPMIDAGIDGIAFDAERSQLPESERAAWEEGLEKAIAAVRDVSPLPIAVTVNWRDLSQPELAAALRGAGASVLDVMLYVANPKRVVELTRRILPNADGLPVFIAQSIEPHLSDEESVASLGRSVALSRWRSISDQLSGSPGFAGIMVQSWEDYLRAPQ